jgi:lysophospholipase L1-like esterase
MLGLAGLVLAWVVVPLVAVEVLMFALEPVLSSGFYEYDPDMGYKVRGHVLHEGERTNAFGFNDRDYPLERSGAALRILVLGDSFNWAGGRSGNYVALLEDAFEREHGEGAVEVINAGYPGTHTAEQLVALRKFGLQYAPDLVVLGFFAGNDFLDADPWRKRIIVNDVRLDIDRREERVWLGRPVVPVWRFGAFLSQRAKALAATHAKAEANPPQGERGAVTFSEDQFLSIERGRLEIANVDAHREGRFDERLQHIFGALDAMAALLEARGIDLLVAIHPDEFQVDPGLLDRILARYTVPRDAFDLELPQRILREHLDARGIAYVDLLETFRDAARTRPLYLVRNTHWNRAGNQLAADTLHQALMPRVVESSIPAMAPGNATSLR